MKEANRCNVPTGQQRCPVCDKVRPSTTQLRRHLNDSREAGHISWRNNEREKAKAASDAGVPMPPGQRATGGPAGAFAASTPPYPPAPPPPAYSDVIAGAKPKNAIERIRNLIPDDLAKALERADLPDLSYCPANVREIWESVGGLPRLIPARELYPKGEEHTEFGLFDRCLDALPGDVRMFVNGLESRGTSTKKKTGLRRRLAYWYSRPMCEESKFALSAGIWLPHDELMEVPQSAGGYTPQHEEATEAIWAPPGNITDSHIGRRNEPHQQSRRLLTSPQIMVRTSSPVPSQTARRPSSSTRGRPLIWPNSAAEAHTPIGCCGDSSAASSRVVSSHSCRQDSAFIFPPARYTVLSPLSGDSL